MRLLKALTISMLVLSIITASGCSSDQGESAQPTVTDPTNPGNGDASQNPQPPVTAETNTGDQSREEKIKALQAFIPERLTKKPETMDDFAVLPPGRFAGLSFQDHSEEFTKVLHQLPNIENPDDEIIDMYYLALLGLFAEDYPDPQQIIDNIKFASFGSPDIEDPRYQFKDQYNVEIILDASGSMAEKVDGKTKMEAAKEAIKQFAKSLPKEARVSLRVYGHKGSGKESDKALSCGSSELVYGMQPYSEQKLQASLDQFKPTGFTPIAFSLREAMKDFSNLPGEKNTNIIYLVSDGIETCDGNPVEMAKQLAQSNVTPIVNVIGFGVDGAGQKQLKEIAVAAGGRYVHIQNQDELQKEFKQAEEIAFQWWKWKSKAEFDQFMKRNKIGLDIDGFIYDWEMAASREDYNLYFAFKICSNDQLLSSEVTEKLIKIQEKQLQIANERAAELEAFLGSLNDKTYKEAIKAINKKYSQNASDN